MAYWAFKINFYIYKFTFFFKLKQKNQITFNQLYLSSLAPITKFNFIGQKQTNEIRG